MFKKTVHNVMSGQNFRRTLSVHAIKLPTAYFKIRCPQTSLPGNSVLLNNFKHKPKFIAKQKTAFQNHCTFCTIEESL
jgi:hypothetical protein